VKTLDARELAQITGGIDWGSVWRGIKPYLPPNGPTIPLGPFIPPKPTDPRIA
jgi:bacteriocin-like protein